MVSSIRFPDMGQLTRREGAVDNVGDRARALDSGVAADALAAERRVIEDEDAVREGVEVVQPRRG